MKLNHPFTEQRIQLTSAISLRCWQFKQNQLPRIGAWFNRHANKFVIATCLIAGGFVAGQLASEQEMIARANDIHAASYKDGFRTGMAARKEELAKEVTVKTCMNWYFSGDPTRVGRALKTGVMQ